MKSHIALVFTHTENSLTERCFSNAMFHCFIHIWRPEKLYPLHRNVAVSAQNFQQQLTHFVGVIVGSAREVNVGNFSPLQHLLNEVSVTKMANISTNESGCDFVKDARLFHWGLSGCLLTQAFYLGRVLRTLPPISFSMVARRACRSKPPRGAVYRILLVFRDNKFFHYNLFRQEIPAIVT